MQELTDDQLDGLFRKLSGETEPPHDPAAWAAMQRKLDSHDQTRPVPTPIWKHLLRWGLPVLLLLLLSVGSWVVYQQRSEVVGKTKPTSTTAVELATNDATLIRQPDGTDADGQHRMVSPTDAQAPEGRSDNAPPTQTRTTPAAKRATLPEVEEATNRSNYRATIAAKVGNVVNKPGTKPATRAVQERKRRGRVGASVESSGLVAAVSTDRENGNRPQGRIQHRRNRAEKTYRPQRRTTPLVSASWPEQQAPVAAGHSKTSNVAPVAEEPLHNASTGGLPGADNVEQNTRLSIEIRQMQSRPFITPSLFPTLTRAVTYQPDPPTEVATAPIQQPIAPERGLSVRLVVSPDLSAIGVKNFARPGINVGMLLEYRLAPRWSVQAGTLWSRKVYEAYTHQYEWPYRYRWKVMPEGVTGRCDMIDIPLNIRYDVAVRPRSRWFVSGGATSYIITREEYTYNYANPNDPNIGSNNRQRLIDSTSRYGFSQLNFSVGYERLVSRRLSWQVEPFVKMPLGGVGYYKINLLSTGVFFSLRYQLTSAPPRKSLDF